MGRPHRFSRELAIAVLVAVVAQITGLLLHRYIDHAPTAPAEAARIEQRDAAAEAAAVSAGSAAERQEAEKLQQESDDQVLAEAPPAVQAAVDQAIRDHEWEHHGP